MNNIKAYVSANKDRFISELIELLKIPSVSADSAFSQDVINDCTERVIKSLLIPDEEILKNVLQKNIDAEHGL